MSNIIRPEFGKQEADHVRKPEEEISGYQLLVEIAFSSPSIYRRIRIPGDASLAELHKIIQNSFGWGDDHSHRFFIGKIFYGPPSGDRTSSSDENSVQLHELDEWMPFTFTYFYDAGSGWECEISVEEKLDQGTISTPEIIDGDQANPPQDFIDIHEYQSFRFDLENAPEDEKRTILAQYNLAHNFNPVYFDAKGSQSLKD